MLILPWVLRRLEWQQMFKTLLGPLAKETLLASAWLVLAWYQALEML